MIKSCTWLIRISYYSDLLEFDEEKSNTLNEEEKIIFKTYTLGKNKIEGKNQQWTKDKH